MYPHERSLVETYKNRPFAIVGVNSDSLETLQKVRADGTVLWRSFWDGGNTQGPIATRWNVRGWPTLYLLDHTGRIRFRDTRGEALDEAIAELVTEAEAASAGSR